MTTPAKRFLFGAAYYHEYHRGDRLKWDLDTMRDAHFSVIRVGESVWSTWEPDDAIFDLDWLEPVLDGAHERSISVILGTPTYAVPPWLARLYPEIAGERSTGTRVPWGARQEVDFTHPAFRFHAERVIRQILPRYVDHPAVIGIQVDNEPGNELLHNHGVFQRFVDHLRRTYGDVESLNREWGLAYWSHRLSTWADLWAPDGNLQPQYDVAWRRFQAAQTTEFIHWQAQIAREYTRPDQFVTTCIAYHRPALDDVELTANLDVTAGNAYYMMQDGLRLPDNGGHSHQWTTTGTWALFQTGDRMFASKQERFLVTETNAMHVGFPWNNKPAFDGQWRQAAWALVARGASMIEYWHWHTLHFGAETYWGGVLPHSGQPGRAYAELARLGGEFEQLGNLVATLLPESDVAFVYSTPSKWLMQKYPPLALENGGPDHASYHGLLDPFYRGFFDANCQVRILHESQFPDPVEAASLHAVLVVPGLYLITDETLDWLEAYAEAGGHLIIGPCTAYGDHEGRARDERAPAKLNEIAGIWYDEYSNISDPVPVKATTSSGLRLADTSATATRWIEGLTVVDADVLAEYDHPHFGRWPAVTTKRHRSGRVTYVGTVPSQELAAALASWAAPNPVHGWVDVPDSVTVSTSRTPSDDQVHIVHNWAWAPCEATAPYALVDALSGEPVEAGERVQLGSWDVRVLVSAHPRQ
jgi:beta-galactosidase